MSTKLSNTAYVWFSKAGAAQGRPWAVQLEDGLRLAARVHFRDTRVESVYDDDGICFLPCGPKGAFSVSRLSDADLDDAVQATSQDIAGT